MRKRWGAALAFVALGLMLVAPAEAMEVVPAPAKVPPGAQVSLLVRCAGSPAFAGVQLRTAATSPPSAYDATRNLLPPVAHRTGDEAGFFLIEVGLPIDSGLGSYAFDVFCLSAAGTVIDGPASGRVEVALLPLTVTPARGHAGTRVTVTGAGCPARSGVTVFVRVRGGEDQVPSFDPETPGQVTAPAAVDGSFSLAFNLPADMPDGENSVQSFCTVQPEEGPSVPVAGPGFAVFVVAPLPATGTGSGTAVIAAVGVVLIGAGVLALRLCGRRALPGDPRSRGGVT